LRRALCLWHACPGENIRRPVSGRAEASGAACGNPQQYYWERPMGKIGASRRERQPEGWNGKKIRYLFQNKPGISM